MVRVTIESGGATDPLPPGKSNWMGKYEPGGWCSIKVNNAEEGLNSIGLNIVVLKYPEQNPPEHSTSFDLCKDPTACNALVGFFRGLQPNRYILMSACCSITDCLSQELCDELAALGSGYFRKPMQELSGAHRNESWVMVCQKGVGLIKESFRPAGSGPTVENVDIN
ncbi:PREDICTED: uncharacterized protein LOC109481869 [Branchiostoma belcheri]|uniref:Uncharacterized protein LOC109481869 n=1 Tax=Branchiostoma belcheri TaxID=7741 RepID=A0A6P5A9N1_BRABE|nr:PREDICTED: uncharacterized protein LOC109481869 [Branchiostoma belcheri]